MARSEDYIKQDRNLIYQGGGDIQRRSRERGDQAGERYGNYTQSADEQYIPILEGRGGYSPYEQERILGEDRLGKMELTGDQVNAAHLTADEKNAIRGQGWDRAKFYDPQGDLNAVTGREGQQQGIVDRMGGELDAAITPGLNISDAYGRAIDSAITGGGARVRGAIDPTKLGLSEEFMANYRMTPQQKEALLNSVARDSTAVSQAEMDRNMEAARAAGMDPMGQASYLERANRKSRQDMNRALADARVTADEARANRELGIEDRRLGAERGIAGMRADTELALQGRELQAAQGKEDTRLGSERDISSRRMGAATTTGQARMGTEQAAADRAQQQRQFNTQTGTGIMRDMTDANTATEQWLAQNRQNTEFDNRGDVYDRQKYVDQQTAGRTGAVAEARRGDEREARGYLTDQIAQTGNREQQERNRELQTWGTQVGGAVGTTQAQQAQDNQPKWWEKLIGGVAGAATGLGSMGVKF